MNVADYRADAQPFLERIASYAESPDGFRARWSLRHFRFRWSSWLTVAIFLAPLAWIAWTLGDVHVALKGVLAVMALIAVLPLARDFRREQCVLCDEQPLHITAQRLDGDDFVVTACDRCRVYRVRQADSAPLPL